MALIKCPECGKEISDKSKQCIHCGYPLGSDINNDYEKNGLYKIILTSAGSNKVQVIRIIRECTGIGLADAKSMIDKTPSVIQVGLSFDKCEKMQNIFLTYGAQTKIEPDQNSKQQNHNFKSINVESMSKPGLKVENGTLTVCCPKCKSSSVITGQRGFSIFTGFIGSNKTMNRCANCGHKWYPHR